MTHVSSPDRLSISSSSSRESIDEDHSRRIRCANSQESGVADDIFQESIEIIERFGRNIAVNDSLCEEDFNELPSVMAEFLEIKRQFEISHRVFNSVMGKINSISDEELNAEEMLKVYQNKISKKFAELSNENNEFCNQFENMLFNRKEKMHDDSEITTVAENVNAVDPITKLPLTDPVKNIKCGHSYEKSTIMAILNKKENVKCPIPGCIAATFIDKADLVPDIALKRFLKN